MDAHRIAKELLMKNGPDSLEPTWIPADPDDDFEITIIPKFRTRITNEEWFQLPQSVRICITDLFIQSLTTVPVKSFPLTSLNLN